MLDSVLLVPKTQALLNCKTVARVQKPLAIPRVTLTAKFAATRLIERNVAAKQDAGYDSESDHDATDRVVDDLSKWYSVLLKDRMLV